MVCEVTVNRHDMYISLCISLVSGELTPSQHTDMLGMALGESLTVVSYAQQAWLHSARQPCVSLTDALSLSVTSTGKVRA